MIKGAFGDGVGIGFTLYYATDFIFTGLAVAVAAHAGLFNIGGDGQAYVAGLGALAAGMLLGNTHWLLVLPVATLFAAGVGAAWAFIPGYLQAKRGSHVVITTIMFNFIGAALMVFLLNGPLKSKDVQGAESAAVTGAGLLAAPADLHSGLWLRAGQRQHLHRPHRAGRLLLPDLAYPVRLCPACHGPQLDRDPLRRYLELAHDHHHHADLGRSRRYHGDQRSSRQPDSPCHRHHGFGRLHRHRRGPHGPQSSRRHLPCGHSVRSADPGRHRAAVRYASGLSADDPRDPGAGHHVHRRHGRAAASGPRVGRSWCLGLVNATKRSHAKPQPRSAER